MTQDRDPRPIRPSPILYEDDEELDELAFEPSRPTRPPGQPRRPTGNGGGFRPGPNEMRVIGLVVLLAVVILVLILPPISALSRGGASTATAGIVTKARTSMPTPPQGVEAMSALYDIEGDRSLPGPISLTVQLTRASKDATNLAFYTYTGSEWRRLGTVSPTADGRGAKGQLDTIPENIAVFQRAALAYQYGAMLAPGETLDPAAGTPGIVSVLGAEPAASDDGVQLSERLPTELRGRYLGISSGTSSGAAAINRILTDPAAAKRHIDAIVGAAGTTRASGVHIDYQGLEPSRRAAFTSFIKQLAERLKADQRGLVVTVPTTPGGEPGAYDWPALGNAANAVWLRAPADPAAYYDTLEAALRVRRENGVDLKKVSLVLDRRSREHAGELIRAISLRDALTIASTVSTRLAQGIAPGDAVTLSGPNIDQDAGSSGLRWDDRSRSVTFAYAGRGGARTVWIENRYSAAFRLDLAKRYGLGGVVVDAAGKDETLPDLWNAVTSFVEDGNVRLELPYGPYLQPSWRASEGQVEAAARSGAAVWRAPSRPGVYDITLIVSDGVVFVGQQLSFRVAIATPTPTGSPSASPTAATTTPTGTPVGTPSGAATPARAATATATPAR
ncbi:MAG: hypothetical protein EXR61_05465 [Chloroflexi bacterium]|nr:hypothetical protein [Chloroflexota bacterium]